MPPGKPPPDKFPDLPLRSGPTPWPAPIVDSHAELKAIHDATSRALNLDESDPIRLRHYEKQIKTAMLSTLQALAASENPSLPERYIKGVANSIERLVDATSDALNSSLKQ